MLRHKYNNKITVYKGIKYRSQLEARYAKYLDRLIEAGEVIGFLRQVKFHFPDGNSYTADFQVWYSAGYCEHIDTKGTETETFKNKMKMMDYWYPWAPIIKVKSGDFK